MIKLTSTVVGLLLMLLSLSSLAQRGSDPAVLGRDLSPAPLAGMGSPFSMTFSIGNNGAVPILGNTNANRMGFSICLSKCALNATNPLDALSGPLLNYFDLSINPATGCIDGIQKLNVTIPIIVVYDLYIDAVVTVPSTNTSINDIGASCNIAPNPSSQPQPQANDFNSIYTHTVTTELPVSLVKFTAQAQADRTVLLSWSSSWEKANGKYVVERSKDLKQFESIGEVVDVAGTSSSLSQYRYVDRDPYRGRSYYRLVQVDVSGSRHEYPAAWVEVDGKYGVYPNPVTSAAFSLELDEPTTSVLHLYNASGVEMSISKSALTEDSAQVKPLTKLSSGVYILTVEERGTVRKHRLVVQ